MDLHEEDRLWHVVSEGSTHPAGEHMVKWSHSVAVRLGGVTGLKRIRTYRLLAEHR